MSGKREVSAETRAKRSEAMKRSWARRRREAAGAPPEPKPHTHVMGGCGNCPPKPVVLDLDLPLHPGFGQVYLQQDGQERWPWGDEWDAHEDKTGRDFEAVAARSPKDVWEIYIYGPLATWRYRRVAANTWTMVEKGRGFA